MAGSSWPPDYRSAVDRRTGEHHAYLKGGADLWCGQRLGDMWNLTDEPFGPNCVPMCRLCWSRTGGDDGFFQRGFGVPAEDVLAQWETLHFPLTPKHRAKFLNRIEVRHLRLLPPDAVRKAFERERKLDRAIQIAENIAWNREGGKQSPEPRKPKKKKKQRRSGGTGRSRGYTDPGPGPTGFYGDTGKLTSRAPDFDPHPQRMCLSCGRPESVCACR